MPFAMPTLEAMTPMVDDVFKLVRSFDIAKDGEWSNYLLDRTVYLVKENLKAALGFAIKDELENYVALYGHDYESTDVPDYWEGFDEELSILFAPVIEGIGDEAFDAILPGHDMSDASTVWAICDELAEQISMTWPAITNTLTSVSGIDKIKMGTDEAGRDVVWIDGSGAAPFIFKEDEGVPPSHLGIPIREVDSLPFSPPAEVPPPVNYPRTPGAPPLSAIKGQPNGQLLAEAFSIIRERLTDNELVEAGRMSRSTFLNYSTGKSTPRLRVDQAQRLRQLLDIRLERLQHAINIFAQVTRDS